jgi:hypothetical protein
MYTLITGCHFMGGTGFMMLTGDQALGGLIIITAAVMGA